MHLLAGLQEPTTGSVDWPAIGDRGALRPGPVGVVFQGPSLLPPLTVRRERRAAAPADGRVGARGATPRRSSSLALVGLAELAGKLPDELSGGQAQRVAIARALVDRAAADPRRRADGPARPRQRRPRDRRAARLPPTRPARRSSLTTHDPSIAEPLRAALVGRRRCPRRRTSRCTPHDAAMARGPHRASPRHASSPRPPASPWPSP